VKSSILPLAVLVTLSLAVVTGAARTATAAVPAGAACVAIPVPSVIGVEGSATTYASAVRDLFASFLTGPSIKVVKLEARLPSQAALEARQQGCELIAVTTVTLKRSGGSGVGRVFGRAAGIAAARTPMGSGVTGRIASGATSALGEAVYALAAQTRAKDEIELSYRLAAPDSIARVTPISARAKAKSDGEDLLTPLVERAANSIVTTATSEKKP
jgi:hypothetical protein